jgi:hypothetical protein
VIKFNASHEGWFGFAAFASRESRAWRKRVARGDYCPGQFLDPYWFSQAARFERTYVPNHPSGKTGVAPSQLGQRI